MKKLVLLASLLLLAAALLAFALPAAADGTTALLRYDGCQVRLDGRAGVRVRFAWDENEIAALEADGATVEIGALLTVSPAETGTLIPANAAPTLDHYDYRVVFREGGETNEAFLLSREDGVAVAAFGVEINKLNPDLGYTSLRFAGYVAVTRDGERTVTTVNAPATSAFAAYRTAVNDAGYAENAFAQRKLSACYLQRTVLLDEANGDDANDGVTLPVKTPARAFELLKSWLGSIVSPMPVIPQTPAGSEPETPSVAVKVPLSVTFSFAAGRYEVPETLELKATSYANRNLRLTFRGTGEDTVITSCTPLDNAKFREVSGKDYYVYQFEPDEEGNYPQFRFFYADGRVQKESTNGFDRTADAEAEAEDLLRRAGETYYMGTGNTKTQMFTIGYAFHGVDDDLPLEYKLYLPEEAFEGMTDEDFETGQLEFYVSIAWYMRVLHIVRVDREDRQDDGAIAAYFVPDEIDEWSAAHTFAGNYFWLRGALSFVDEAGEFFYNRKTGTLYYNPSYDVNIRTSLLEIPQNNDAMFGFIGTSDVTFDGVTFYGNDNRIFMEQGSWYSTGQATTSRSPKYGTDAKAALYFQNTTRTTVKNCVFHDLTASGIKFTGVTKNALVDSNRITHIGCTAIDVGAHSGTFDLSRYANENVRILRNDLDDIAWFTYGSVAIYVSVSRNLEIAYNTVTNTSYSAVSIGWRWEPGNWEFGEYWQTYHADVHHNYFRGFMSDLSDGGAVYTLGGNVNNDYHEYFNDLHDNYCWFDRTTWDGKGMVMPWYHDGGSSNWHTYHNVEVLTPYRSVHTPVYLQNGSPQDTHNILVEDNDFIAAIKSWRSYRDEVPLTESQIGMFVFGRDWTRAETEEGVPNRADPGRFLYGRDNRVWDHPDFLPDDVFDRMAATGSPLRPADPFEMIDAQSPIYDLWYAELEEAYLRTAFDD